MRLKSGILALTLSCMPLAGIAGDQPVVVELYTSQGCSSCPPADELLADLAENMDVLPLALHVDYWDYIGWTDIFGDPAHTARQKGYARAAGQRTIYTPQMVIEGVDHVVGHEPMQVMDLIRKHKARADTVALDANRQGDRILIAARPAASDDGPYMVHLVRYTPRASVEIARGENAGHTLDYTNIVTEWQTLGEWTGEAPLTLDAAGGSDDPAAVLIQKPQHGAIVAAVRVE